MAIQLRDWVRTHVQEVKDRPIKWLSEEFFFRDPFRARFSDLNYFFSPADGVILYQRLVQPGEAIVSIKGKDYTLAEALREERADRPSLVIGIFMTFYDVHINRIPYPGVLSYRELEPIQSHNVPMLDMEEMLVNAARVDIGLASYLHHNQRVLNRVFSPALMDDYYILQIADYDVDRITPFRLAQNQPVDQNQRFSQIRFGSQVELVIPLGDAYTLETVHSVGVHVEAGVDPLVKISLTK